MNWKQFGCNQIGSNQKFWATTRTSLLSQVTVGCRWCPLKWKSHGSRLKMVRVMRFVSYNFKMSVLLKGPNFIHKGGTCESLQFGLWIWDKKKKEKHVVKEDVYSYKYLLSKSNHALIRFGWGHPSIFFEHGSPFFEMTTLPFNSYLHIFITDWTNCILA